MHTLYHKLYNENCHWPENMSIWLLVPTEVNQTPDQLPLHKVMFILYSAHRTLDTGHCTMHTVYFTLYIAHYTLYTVQCFCTLHTSHCAPVTPPYLNATTCTGKKVYFLFFFTELLQGPDMENVPSKPSAARVIIFGLGKFLVSTYTFFCRKWQKYFLICFTTRFQDVNLIAVFLQWSPFFLDVIDPKPN